jgi:hypothetical protein
MSPGKRIVGTCSLCSGPVTVTDVPPRTGIVRGNNVEWEGGSPGTPTCENCGAVAIGPHGPVITMYLRPGSIVAVMD